MANLTRSASLTGFAGLMRSLGVDPRPLATAANVPLQALDSPDLKIDGAAIAQLLEAGAARAGIEDLGLRLAEARRLSNLGPVGMIVRDQPSLRRALDIVRQYVWLHNEALLLSLDESEEIAVARIDLAVGGAMPRQAVELCVGVMCITLRTLMGPRWRPETVAFRHARPARLDTHRRVFACNVEFLHDFDGLVLARGDLDAPIPAADPDMARQIERYVEQMVRNRSRATRDIVGETIVLLLPTGACTADHIAAHLGTGRRTLHRRLADEDTTVQHLLDERRSELVLSLLTTDRSLGAIADLAGFSSLSAFSRWFSGRFGHAPSHHRARMGAT